MGAKRILLIDDDADFRGSIRTLLESAGYEVMEAPDGTVGLATARKEKPALLILDVMMTHDTEGFDVSRKLRELPGLRDLPVILLTGMHKAMNLPFKFETDPDWLPVQRILEKPVTPDTLLAAVRDLLAD